MTISEHLESIEQRIEGLKGLKNGQDPLLLKGAQTALEKGNEALEQAYYQEAKGACLVADSYVVVMEREEQSRAELGARIREILGAKA